MITSKFLLSVISLKFENVVNGNGKAKTDKARPPCFISSRLDIFFVSVIFFIDVCRFLMLKGSMPRFVLLSTWGPRCVGNGRLRIRPPFHAELRTDACRQPEQGVYIRLWHHKAATWEPL